MNQHLAFCERQCALIHIEQVWEENRLTAEGRILHERVHGEESRLRDGVYTARGLMLRSFSLGLAGIADVVEFSRVEHGGVCLPGKKHRWLPFPVEYKRGRPKADRCDEVQLCGQAICLEEMLNCRIERGALYYGAQHKRYDVVFDGELRAETARMARRLHELIGHGVTPPAVYQKRCDRCSLKDVCMPQAPSSPPHPLIPSPQSGEGMGEQNGETVAATISPLHAVERGRG